MRSDAISKFDKLKTHINTHKLSVNGDAKRVINVISTVRALDAFTVVKRCGIVICCNRIDL